ncbi:glycerophosphoryl diester phosphodiesterase membrane domain-containing protein [uncultured Sunxiuqinia sp.]|uniref:glycerophosphoryl diester phosphodiesterase membrane domain-containing protein n=1 Tax=uncultured Sunxiuqinia sp. TaxID=1573825 RepID=UPI002AA67F7F|nr:glycerophosphoryl diester phosphodiesterase membrane domain-containing protein [uncultured Sunxiuqinia sp.]
MNKVFRFRQTRDFGTVMNHSFDFIKAEYKRLGKALLIYVLPFLILTGILLVFIQSSMMNTMQKGIQPGANMFQNYSWSQMASSYTLQLLNFTVLSTVVLSFINLYISKKGDFELSEIKPTLLKTGGKLLIANIVVGVFTIVATIMLIVPGIYLGVVFALVAPIIVFENKSLGKALNRSFELIKNNWWKTFGILIIAGLIIYIFSVILSIPLIASVAVKSFHAAQAQSQPQLFSSGYIVMSTVISTIQTLAFTLAFIFISVQYFSLVEEKERPTLQEKIDKLTEENA